jgi:Ca-activated chloride channel homolog
MRALAPIKFLFIKLLPFICIFLPGVQIFGNLAVVAQVQNENATNANRQMQGPLSAAEGLKIQTEVNLITADVSLIGTPVSELNARDFIIYDNSVAQQITYFSRDQLPIAIAILIDRSPSTIPYFPILQIAGITALKRLKPEDQVALFCFDRGYKKLSDLTEDRLLIADKILRIKPGESTNIYNALYEAAKYLKKNAPQRRHAIILISDNESIVFYPDRMQCNVELIETATTLYDIKISADFPFIAEDPGIRWLAEESGGEVLDVRGATSLKTALENATTQLRMQYTIGFNISDPGKPGSFHELNVQIPNKERCPGCQLLVRSGYYAGFKAPVHLMEKAETKPQRTPQKADNLLTQRSILIAGTSRLDLNEIPFVASANKQTDSQGRLSLQVDLNIDPKGIDLSSAEGPHACKIIVAIFYAHENGTGLGSGWWQIDQRFGQEDYLRIMKTGIVFSAEVPLKAKDQILRIVLYDVRSDKMGSRLLQLH